MELSKKRTKIKCIPIADCPGCGLKDTPLSQKNYKMEHKDTGKKIEFTLIACPQCDILFNWDEDTMKHIKGYVSIKDLENMGYTKELEGE